MNNGLDGRKNKLYAVNTQSAPNVESLVNQRTAASFQYSDGVISFS